MSNTEIHVLVVEDNPADAVLLKTALAESTHGKFVVTHARRLQEALAQLAPRQFDVVLLDLGLPDSQGLDTLHRVQKLARAMPIVVLTGLNDETTGTRALQSGAQDYMVKGEMTGNRMARAVRFAVERKRVEEAFLASEQRLMLAVDAVHMGIWDFNTRTGQIAWSHHHAALFGQQPGEFDGTLETFMKSVHPDDRAQIQAKVQRALAEGSGYRNEFRVIWPDKSIHWIEARARILHDEQNEPTRMLGTVVDITQRKLDEEEARAREAELAHFDRIHMMGQMASGLAHELNQPLGAILNYASVCLEPVESNTGLRETSVVAIREIMNETRRAGAIISRMRAFVRKQKPRSAPLEINALVKEAINILEFELRRQTIVPGLQLACGLPKVQADSVQIEQVLVNLIYNALEAMAEAGREEGNELKIQTALSKDGRLVEISVTDNGPGVSPGEMERLFEPFFTTKSLGLGMGLNISRSIVESHGGLLTAASNPGGGMRFSFSLPIVEGVNP
jgi:PAS domain S-box-containing protein